MTVGRKLGRRPPLLFLAVSLAVHMAAAYLAASREVLVRVPSPARLPFVVVERIDRLVAAAAAPSLAKPAPPPLPKRLRQIARHPQQKPPPRGQELPNTKSEIAPPAVVAVIPLRRPRPEPAPVRKEAGSSPKDPLEEKKAEPAAPLHLERTEAVLPKPEMAAPGPEPTEDRVARLELEPPAVPAPEAPDASEVERLLTEIRHRIEREKRYPSAARRRGLHGEAEIRFALNRDGTIAWARIDRSSGWEILDRASLESLERAAPFPYLKAEISYRLRYAPR